MKKLTLFCMAFSLLAFAHAQNREVHGTVSDTSGKQSLHHASVILLRAADSVLYQFVRTDEKGQFSFPNVTAGKYIFLVSYPSYADYTDNLSVEKDRTDLGTIPMNTVAHLLASVEVRQKIAAMRMKGDTLEFKADSFKVRAGASVEEMLQQIPGIQIDKDGKITAMGKSVKKVLVDGEEFFGNDPTIATKNLQADAIDKVQVYDKKSDQATFTGIDDGQTEKTINLKMKDDKKKGYFGKLELGDGTDDKWNNTFMFNRFRRKSKFSVYGIMSSTGKTGLSWQESDQYGGNNLEYNDDYGYFSITGSNDDLTGFGGTYYGEGLPKTWSAGVNYSDKFNDEKEKLNASYKFTRLNVENVGNTLTQSIISPSSSLFTNESRSSFNSGERHTGNFIYDMQLDSSLSVKLTATGYTGNNTSYSSYQKQTTDQNQQLINQSSRVSNLAGTVQNLQTTLLIKKKFAKPGRTLSLSLEQSLLNSSTATYLLAPVKFFTGGILTSDSITDQLKNNDSRTSTLMGKLVYTEPLAKRLFLELNYVLRSNKNNSSLLSFDKSAAGKYETLDTVFSNNYHFDVLTNIGGASFKFNGKKVTFTAGSDIANTHFTQQDLIRDSLSTRDYINFYPRSVFSYKFAQNTRLDLRYSGSTHQPSIQQIQPVKNNSDPLSIVIGNPALKEQFTHDINLNYDNYNVLTEANTYAYVDFSSISNAIVSNVTTDVTTGKTSYQYTNINGNYNLSAYADHGFKIKKWDMRLNTGLNMSMSRYNNLINGVENTTNTAAPAVSLSVNKFKEKKYQFYLSAQYQYNISSSSLQPTAQNNYWMQTYRYSLNLTLPAKFEFNMDGNITLRQKTQIFDNNNNVFLLNAYIGRKILKGDKGLIKISGNDILDQNKGYTRYATNNVISENNYSVIRRYFMISLVWNFSNTPLAPAAK